MLKHEDISEASSRPAAQVRVTPEELAAAITRLEARQGGMEGTIPLGDAVQELGLNTTPEELLREIEAGRAHHQASPPHTRLAKAGRTTAAAVIASLVLLGGIFAFRSETPAPSATVAVSAPKTAQDTPIIVPATLLVQQRDGSMVLLSEVAENRPVFCDLAGTDTGAKLTDFVPGHGHWTLIKHSRGVYIRGWIGDMSEKALEARTVEIHPNSYSITSGMHPVRVTVPIDGFQSSSLTNDTMICASHIAPDGHLKEKWQP